MGACRHWFSSLFAFLAMVPGWTVAQARSIDHISTAITSRSPFAASSCAVDVLSSSVRVSNA
jgi:hypothetical protein